MKMNENTISVDNIHKLNYELHGNPKGNTILFVHGGPGLGVKKTDLNFFDLSKQNVILFDQTIVNNALGTIVPPPLPK